MMFLKVGSAQEHAVRVFQRRYSGAEHLPSFMMECDLMLIPNTAANPTGQN